VHCPADASLAWLSSGAQVKVAEHILTGHKVAIKILNRKKIKQMDMEEKGERSRMEHAAAAAAPPPLPPFQMGTARPA
jgi:hypothetical protein